MTFSSKNYFRILGLKSNASVEEIKKAFKELAFQFHPDRNPHNPVAEERFKETLEAYTYLTGNFEAYRALQTPPVSPRTSSDQIEDILKILFDIDSSPALLRKSRPLDVALELSLQEAFSGASKTISVERQDLCPSCRGSGVEKGAKVFTCTYCFGEGEIGEGDFGKKECPRCLGRGFLSSQGCLSCRARGTLKKSANLRVKIPAPVSDGQVIWLTGEGNEKSAGERGDIQVTLRLQKDPSFIFDGKDIICEVTVPMSDAAMGGEITVPTLRGSTKFKLPAGTQTGQVFRLKGLGLGGDQFFKIKVKTPLVVTEKQRAMLRQIQEPSAEIKNGILQRLKKWLW